MRRACRQLVPVRRRGIRAFSHVDGRGFATSCLTWAAGRNERAPPASLPAPARHPGAAGWRPPGTADELFLGARIAPSAHPSLSGDPWRGRRPKAHTGQAMDMPRPKRRQARAVAAPSPCVADRCCVSGSSERFVRSQVASREVWSVPCACAMRRPDLVTSPVRPPIAVGPTSVRWRSCRGSRGLPAGARRLGTESAAGAGGWRTRDSRLHRVDVARRMTGSAY